MDLVLVPSSTLRVFWLIAFALPALAADQALKAWVVAEPTLATGGSIPLVPGWFALTVTRNFGSAWSMLWGQTSLLLAISTLASIGVTWWALTSPHPRIVLIGSGMLLGGTLGNLMDRARLGFVVDMFDLQYGGRNIFPVFNIADVCIDIGIGLLILHSVLEGRREKQLAALESAAQDLAADSAPPRTTNEPA